MRAFCLDCDYDLTGLTEHRCPECGRAFDPADPRSFCESLQRHSFGWQSILAWVLLLLAFLATPDAWKVQNLRVATFVPGIVLFAVGFGVAVSGTRCSRGLNRLFSLAALVLYAIIMLAAVVLLQ